MKLTRSRFLALTPSALFALTPAARVGGAFAAPTDAAPSSGDVLKTLRHGHPRLLITDERMAKVKRLCATDATAKRYRAAIEAGATKMLAQPPVEYKLIGPRLLDKSRTCLMRVYHLATMYRLDGDPKWLLRAKQELFTVCAFADWHPAHFLDTAEMTHAVAIGYDWLYGALTPDERATIRTALRDKGLKIGQLAYAGSKDGWWAKVDHNWNLVCNGGLTLGALAVGDEEPVIAASIVDSARVSAPRAMRSYGPDGGWIEGPGYWSYATRYAVAMLAGLQSALGTDFGLSQTHGFEWAGTYRIYFTGPNERTFNFADGGERTEDAPEMRWLGQRFGQPLFDWEANRAAARDPQPLDLLWYRPTEATPRSAHAPLDNVFRKVDVALLRSAWEDPNALFVGFKGGDNAANHSHLDLGAFVFDALGERWASNLGSDNYNLPGYFGKERFTYFRLATIGQNTLVLNGGDQGLKARAPLVAFASKTDRGYAVADLTDAYKALGASRVQRGVALINDRTGLLVQDEVVAASADAPVDYRWQIHTQAMVAVSENGKTATLTRNGKTLSAVLFGPLGATFEALSDAPPPINGGQAPQQNPNTGFTRLAVRLPARVKEVRVAVLLAAASGAARVAAITPLAEWIAAAPPLPTEGGRM